MMMIHQENEKIRYADLPIVMRRMHRIAVPRWGGLGEVIKLVEPIWHQMLEHGNWVELGVIVQDVQRMHPDAVAKKNVRDGLLQLAAQGWFSSRNPQQIDVKSSVKLEFRARIAARQSPLADARQTDQFAGLVRVASVFELADALHG
jgi:hypothetical protein